MRQQINLYRGSLVKKTEPLQSRPAGYILFGISLLLVLFYVLTFLQVSTSKRELANLKEQKQLETTRVAELEKQYPEPKENSLLKKRLRQLELDIQGQRQALIYFTDRESDGNLRILSSLEGLARSPFKGLWLRRVRLQEAGNQVELAGSTLTAEFIPDYLKMIGEKDVFAGKVFAELKIERMQQNDNRIIDFTLGSSRGKN